MRNKRNYLIALSLACIIGTSVSSNAINAKAEIDGDLSIEEGGKEYILTEEDALLDQKKLEEDIAVPFAAGDFNIDFKRIVLCKKKIIIADQLLLKMFCNI